MEKRYMWRPALFSSAAVTMNILAYASLKEAINTLLTFYNHKPKISKPLLHIVTSSNSSRITSHHQKTGRTSTAFGDTLGIVCKFNPHVTSWAADCASRNGASKRPWYFHLSQRDAKTRVFPSGFLMETIADSLQARRSPTSLSCMVLAWVRLEQFGHQVRSMSVHARFCWLVVDFGLFRFSPVFRRICHLSVGNVFGTSKVPS